MRGIKMTMQLENRLTQRKQLGNLRQIQISKNLIDFASNDYLGLSRSPELGSSVLKEWLRCDKPFNGMGSTGSPLLTGNSSYIQHVEDKLAQFHGYQSGLLFNCGYMANLGLITAVARKEDAIFFDIQVHASMHDGIRLSQAQAFPFRHNDLAHLENCLKRTAKKGKRWICIESLYSTDGSKAPLQEIARLSKLYDAHLIVDEAHAIGVWGHRGQGLIEESGKKDAIFAQITTFGKAIGVHGAIVFGSHILKQVLINFARTYIYSTALPFHVVAAIHCSYKLFPSLENERRKIRHLIHYYRKITSSSSETQIQCLKVKGNFSIKHVSQRLKLAGFDIRPLMSPTVRRGHEILRICLHAFNTEEQIDNLVQHIEDYKKGKG